ncbi:MAG TPA: DUF167 domain-containing protein [Ignavibacteria bacterium]|jgi:uncharacterized protein (TIGR00251 family)|nr:DUF167 domain-containing protein [Ignavibacteria bacterium]
MRISVKVKPNARQNSINQVGENTFEVRVTVPPEKGKANKKVIELLAKHFHTAKSNIELVSGETSKEKVFEITN